MCQTVMALEIDSGQESDKARPSVVISNQNYKSSQIC